MNKHWTTILGVVLVFTLAEISGCAYRLGTTLPANLRTVFIPTFKNSTYQTGIEIDITNEVIQRFRIDGNLRPVSAEDADTVPNGEITGSNRQVLSDRGDTAETVEEYRLYVNARITFKDVRNGKVLISQQEVRGKTDFFIEGTLADSEELARPDA
ncbi:MAG: LptE family protein, partial [Candidatus Aureabacteria bacterium]|nr:LptE family protein [Candidatus Auribacterota bacterium]